MTPFEKREFDKLEKCRMTLSYDFMMKLSELLKNEFARRVSVYCKILGGEECDDDGVSDLF